MIDYVCRYAPLELMAGFGESCSFCNLPVESFSEADKLVHRNLCSFARSLVQVRSNTGASTLKPLLLTDCCNSIRRAGEALAMQGQAVYLINLPHNDYVCARRLYAAELKRLISAFGNKTGKEFCVQSFVEAWRNAAGRKGIDKGSPTGEASSQDPNCPEQAGRGPYVAVVGARASNALIQTIQQKSRLPVLNLTCTGTRSIETPPQAFIAPIDELLESYAGALLSQIPCMRMSNIGNRQQLVLDPNLKAVVYNTVSFCDFYGFEYAHLKNELSVPILKIETDYTLPETGELQTRVEAFFESMDNKSMDNKREHPTIMEMHPSRYFVAGIDSGSTSTNAVILDNKRNIIAGTTVLTGAKVRASAQRALDQALSQAGMDLSEIRRIVTTGYGRGGTGLKADVLTEITCHARGAQFLNENVRTVIDIGGQDSKIIRVDIDGRVRDFAMNDKCAAGTGRFLEMMAQSLGLSIAEMSRGGIAWKENIAISSMCSVFAQSEVVSLIAGGKELDDIIHGLNISIASKVLALAGKNKIGQECMMTGGVANNVGVVYAVQEKLGFDVIVPPQPELCGALGAALSALQEA
ncbi:MAG TPA: acyl-CoA dehydratase activase [Spirochaetales bacterium]|nr:acyl-CoA dehydratase activase [Spirochaetales bacterium]